MVGSIALIALRAGGLSLPSHHQTRYGLRLGLGVLAIIAAVLIYRRRPRKKPEPGKQKKPNLVARLLADPKPVTAFIVGIVMFGPSVTFVAAVQVVASSKADVTATVGAMAMIVVLTVAFAWLPLLAYLIAPGRTARALKGFEAWLLRYRKYIATGAVGLIGVLLVAQGISGWSSRTSCAPARRRERNCRRAPAQEVGRPWSRRLVQTDLIPRTVVPDSTTSISGGTMIDTTPGRRSP